MVFTFIYVYSLDGLFEIFYLTEYILWCPLVRTSGTFNAEVLALEGHASVLRSVSCR